MLTVFKAVITHGTRNQPTKASPTATPAKTNDFRQRCVGDRISAAGAVAPDWMGVA